MLIVIGFQPLPIITKRSILDVAATLDPPLYSVYLKYCAPHLNLLLQLNSLLTLALFSRGIHKKRKKANQQLYIN